MQTLDPDVSRIITVYDYHAGTRIHFGIGDCRVVDDRTTVPPNLYVIRDHRGWYLDMPLEVGDFTPVWRPLDDYAKPLKTPSTQWLIVPESDAYPETSRVRFYNREFDWVTVNFVQVHSNPHLFNATYEIWGPINSTYGILEGKAEIYYVPEKDAEGFFGSFKIVEDHPSVAGKSLGSLTFAEQQLK